MDYQMNIKRLRAAGERLYHMLQTEVDLLRQGGIQVIGGIESTIERLRQYAPGQKTLELATAYGGISAQDSASPDFYTHFSNNNNGQKSGRDEASQEMQRIRKQMENGQKYSPKKFKQLKRRLRNQR